MERGIFIAIGLGVTNIILNTLANRAAAGAASYLDALSRPVFFAAFFAGIGSLSLMIALYTSGYPLARGILIAGATSIILGVIWGTFKYGNSLNYIEWALWCAILFFYVVRATTAFGLKSG